MKWESTHPTTYTHTHTNSPKTIVLTNTPMIKYYKLFLSKKKSKKVIMPSLCAVFLVSTGFVAVITIKSDTPSHPIRTWTTRIELDFFWDKIE